MRCGTSLYWGLQLVCLCPHPLEELRNETGAPWGNSYRYSDCEPFLLCGTLFSAGRWTYKPVVDTEYCNVTVCMDEMICSKIHHSVRHTSERRGQNMERKKCSSRSPNGVFLLKNRVFLAPIRSNCARVWIPWVRQGNWISRQKKREEHFVNKHQDTW